jgi:hypothetical protein
LRKKLIISQLLSSEDETLLFRAWMRLELNLNALLQLCYRIFELCLDFKLCCAGGNLEADPDHFPLVCDVFLMRKQTRNAWLLTATRKQRKKKMTWQKTKILISCSAKINQARSKAKLSETINGPQRTRQYTALA